MAKRLNVLLTLVLMVSMLMVPLYSVSAGMQVDEPATEQSQPEEENTEGTDESVSNQGTAEASDSETGDTSPGGMNLLSESDPMLILSFVFDNSDSGYPMSARLLDAVSDEEITTFGINWTGDSEPVYVPYGDYVVETANSQWYAPQRFSISFSETDTIDALVLERRPAVVVTFTAVLQEQPSIENTTIDLFIESSEGFPGGYAYVQLVDDGSGTYSGQTTLAAGSYSVILDGASPNTNYFTMEPYSLVLTGDPTQVTQPLAVTALQFGTLTIDASGSIDAMATSNHTVTIERNGEYVTELSVSVWSPTIAYWQSLPVGDYTWSVPASGLVAASSGEFSLTTGDNVVPIILETASNGAIEVQGTVPTGETRATYEGRVSLRIPGEEYEISSRHVLDIRSFALGPVVFGEYELFISPYDPTLKPIESMLINVDSARFVVPIAYESTGVQSQMVTFVVTLVPPSGGPAPINPEVFVNNSLGSMDVETLPDGSFTFEAWDTIPFWVNIWAENYGNLQSGPYSWAENGNDVTVQLPAPWQPIEFVVTSSEGPVAGIWLYVECGDATISARTDANGNVTVYGPWETGSQCSATLWDSSQVYSMPDSPHSFTYPPASVPEPVSLEKATDIATGAKVTVIFSGEAVPPGVELTIGGTLSSGDWATVSTMLDENGVATFPTLRTGTYDVSARFSPWAMWPYDREQLGTLTVDQDGASATFTLTRQPTLSVTYKIVTSDGGVLDHDTLIVGGGLDQPYTLSTGNPQVTASVFAGDYYVNVNPTGLYSGVEQPVSISEDNQVITLTMKRIQAVGVTPEPTPGITPVPTLTPTVEPTFTPTVMPTETMTPEPTQPPTALPTETASPTEEPDGEQQLVVHLDLPGDADISGAPFEVWAPTAAQFLAGPLYTGVVGPNNTIVVDGLVPGKYRLVVHPVGMAAIEAVISVGTAPVTEVLVQVSEDGTVEVMYLAAEPTPTSPADPTATSGSTADGVKALPSTGSGSSTSGFVTIGAIVAALVLLLAIPFGMVRDSRRE